MKTNRTAQAIPVARIRVVPGKRGTPSIMTGDTEATAVLNFLQGLIGTVQNVAGMNMPPRHVRKLAQETRRQIRSGRFTSVPRQSLYQMLNSLDKALQGAQEVIYAEQGEDTEAILRHELVHTAQRRLGVRGSVAEHIDAKAFLRCSSARKARASLLEMGCRDEPDELAAEIGAYLAEGDAGAEALGLTRDEAQFLAARYRHAMEKKHGRGAVIRMRELAPVLEIAA